MVSRKIINMQRVGENACTLLSFAIAPRLNAVEALVRSQLEQRLKATEICLSLAVLLHDLNLFHCE
jgi:hypothetical protein